jgi:hypothetical protein
MSRVTDQAILDQVRDLRQRGLTPKAVARHVGLRPSEVTPLIRQIAAQREAEVVEPALVGCWVSPGWSRGLAFPSRPEWAAYDTNETEYPGGLAQVVVARAATRGRVSICHVLVDVFCLGVKNVIPPRTISRGDMTRHVHVSFATFDAPGLDVPLELAQHLVFGAVDYARQLGFEPADDYPAATGHLGTWSGECAIVFGDSGRPVYNAGPYDNPRAVMETLALSCGAGNFGFLIPVEDGVTLSDVQG